MNEDEERISSPGVKPRIGWWVHLVLLLAYPLVLGVLGYLNFGSREETMLPRDTLALLGSMGLELMVFAVIFGIAWGTSRAHPDQLFLRWRGGLGPVWRGLGYSILLRFAIAAAVVVLGAVVVVSGGNQEETLESIRPRTELVVEPGVLVDNPAYLVLCLTLVSFVVGGLREELWRAGVLAGLGALFPRWFQGTKGRLAAVALAALVFGLGHLPQGWGGVAVTAALGLGLGLIMVLHRSIWEAVLAHGFFNALTFGLLYLLARFFPGQLPG